MRNIRAVLARFAIVAASMVLVTACMTGGPGRASLPPLRVREFQTRTYDTTDTKMIMKVLLNVLQDEGFVIKTSNPEIGLLTARKEQSSAPCFLCRFADAVSLTSWDCSVNVTEFGQQTKVRVNVQVTGQSEAGHIRYVSEIDDPAYFQTFFAKVDKGVYIQKERL